MDDDENIIQFNIVFYFLYICDVYDIFFFFLAMCDYMRAYIMMMMMMMRLKKMQPHQQCS
jgi:hypothetical protein